MIANVDLFFGMAYIYAFFVTLCLQNFLLELLYRLLYLTNVLQIVGAEGVVGTGVEGLAEF